MFFYKTLLFSSLVFFTPFFAFAADLIFSPDTDTISAGKTFMVRVMSSSGAQKVNAVEANIAFDRTLLSVESVSKDGSAFTLWTAEPQFSNLQGTITFGGGSPTPFSGNKTLVTIVFKARIEGEAKASFTSGSVLAADGTGKDVLEKTGEALYSISKSVITPPPVSSAPITIDLPPSPVLLSSTHPKEDVWYSVPDLEVKWNVPKDISSLRLLYNDQEKSQPTETRTPPVTEFTKSDLKDGKWYLHVMFQNGSGWGPVTSRSILVDRTPPEQFTIQASQRTPNVKEVTLRLVDAEDKTSGIERYEVSIDGATPTAIAYDQFVNGEYTVSVRSFGEHTISVTAYDRAENSREVSTSVSVKGEDAQKNVNNLNTGGNGDGQGGGSNLGFYLALLITAVAGFLAGMMHKERKHMIEQREIIKHETDEILEKTEILFSLLREEVQDQVARLSAKPNLSAEENAVLKDLKDALELSEELIDKEIEDVRKLVQ